MSYGHFKSASRPKSPPVPVVNPFWRAPVASLPAPAPEPEQVAPATRPPTMREILDIVAYITGVDAHDMRGPWRKVSIVRARVIFCYVARHHTFCTFTKMARFMNRDHSTIIHSVYMSKKRWAEICDDVHRVERALGLPVENPCGKQE